MLLMNSPCDNMSFSSTDVKRCRVKFHKVRKRSMMESTACCLIDSSLNSSLAKSMNLNSSLLISSCARSVSLLKRCAAIFVRCSVVSVGADRTIILGVLSLTSWSISCIPRIEPVGILPNL